MMQSAKIARAACSKANPCGADLLGFGNSKSERSRPLACASHAIHQARDAILEPGGLLTYLFTIPPEIKTESDFMRVMFVLNCLGTAGAERQW
jgi:hypothetical protein